MIFELLMATMATLVALSYASAGHAWSALGWGMVAGLWISDVARRVIDWLVSRIAR